MRILASLCFMCMPFGVFAQDLTMNCVWETECVDLEACEATEYAMEIFVTAGQPPFEVRAETDAGTMTGNALTMGEGLLVQMSSEFGPVFITVDGSGAARQSAHSQESAMMVNYAGQCAAVD